MSIFFPYESRGTLNSLFTLFISVKDITKLNLGHIDKSETVCVRFRFLGHIYDGDGEDDAYLKMCFYFTLEFFIYLDLFSVFFGIKTCPC